MIRYIGRRPIKLIPNNSKYRSIESRIEYGKALDIALTHSIIRYKRYDIDNEVSSEKISRKQLDWYMNNLLKRKEVSMAWACIEPDIDPYTKKQGSTHVHFAYSSIINLTLLQLSKFMRINRTFLRESHPLDFSMGYFTKHVKNLLYHNLYA